MPLDSADGTLADVLHSIQIDGIIGGGKRGRPLHFPNQSIVHKTGAGKVAAVNGLIAPRRNIVNTIFLQNRKAQGESCAVVGNKGFSGDGATVGIGVS